MNAVISPDGVEWEINPETGDVITIIFREIRRSTTGPHAHVAIYLNNTFCDADLFNIARREDRNRLAKSAYDMFKGELLQATFSLKDLQHHLALACLATPKKWAEERIEIVSYTDEPDPGAVRFVIEPFIIEGGGTIVYAPPKSGKSMILQSMAIGIATGQSGIWNVSGRREVLYVNLERDGNSFLRREIALKYAMGIDGYANVRYIHARGMGMQPLREKITNWLSEHEGSGVILDSISRSQSGGSLTDDDTGNKFIDMMNSLNPAWWCAVAHTPRSSSDHIFGSIMYDAGMDIGVKVSHENRDNTLGVRLEITDANDIGNYPAEYIAFEFDNPNSPVTSIRRALRSDFPELAISAGSTVAEHLIKYMQDSPETNYGLTATELAIKTNMQQSNISTVLRDDRRFVKLARDGQRGVPYTYKKGEISQ